MANPEWLDRVDGSKGKGKDQRHEFARDRDRILYCSAFRRLAGVTQVVGVAEGHVFHNRLTHSLKVGQVGRRLGEMFVTNDAKRATRLGVHPEVVEAAALAHDLGHPPFGHVGERTLNECMTKHGQQDHGSTGGYEGNAQSFRIVTKLAMRREHQRGLDLTRATLNAILKCPWTRSAEGEHAKKWGAYHSESEELSFARAMTSYSGACASAFLMDWADDITYSVHDIEDFYRAGIVPLDRLAVDQDEQSEFVETHCADIPDADVILKDLMGLVTGPLRRPFTGTTIQRGALRGFVSTLVERFVQAAAFDSCECEVAVGQQYRTEVDVLKRIMRHYVFEHPALAAQQHGQRLMLSQVFDMLVELAVDKKPRLPRNEHVLPVSIREELHEVGDPVDRSKVARIVADAVAAMTEQQVHALHARLMGINLGSISNKIVY